jgi:hypothetical protein
MELLHRRAFLTGAATLPVAACGASPPGGFTPDPRTIDFGQVATIAAKNLCGLLPTLDTLAKLALAIALPAGTPVEQIAYATAKSFCDSIAPVVAARRRAGQFRMAVDPNTGKAVEDYGFIILPNGKRVPVQVYVP